MRQCLEVAVNEGRMRLVNLALLGHAALVASIVADFFRRSTEGLLSAVLYATCFVALMIGGVVFIRRPRLFFFCSENTAQQTRVPAMGLRLLSWIGVVGTPILWLVIFSQLSSSTSSGLLLRLAGAYTFFAWIALAIVLSPHLFGARGSE